MNPIFSIADQLGEGILLYHCLEVVDGLLRADRLAPHPTRFPHGPAGRSARAASLGADAAVERLLRPQMGGRADEERAAAREIAGTVGLANLETEVYETGHPEAPGVAVPRYRLRRPLPRVRLTWPQRSYLRRLRRLQRLKGRMRELFPREMEEGRLLREARARVGARLRPERGSHISFGLWGVRRRARRPLRNELFWRAVGLLEGVNIANPSRSPAGTLTSCRAGCCRGR